MSLDRWEMDKTSLGIIILDKISPDIILPGHNSPGLTKCCTEPGLEQSLTILLLLS